MGIGGKSGIFQSGPDPWAIENYALVAKYPSGHVIAQDLFAFGAIKWATDFQVYKEIANLSVLDFAYTDNGAVYHTKTHSDRKHLSPSTRSHLAKLDAERWLYKGGLVQWLILLAIGYYFGPGSSYLALVWLVPPAFAYGLLEATLTPTRLSRPLKLATLLVGLSASLDFCRNIYSVSWDNSTNGSLTDRSPGTIPEWLGNVIISTFIALVLSYTSVSPLICSPFRYNLMHYSVGAKRIFVFATLLVFSLSVAAVFLGLAPPFSDDTARAVNVVRVVDATTINSGQVQYGCLTCDETEAGWSESDIPLLYVVEDNDIGLERITRVSIDTKSSIRWVLAINTEEIEEFKLEGASKELISFDAKSSVDGWHVIQFAGSKNSPKKFDPTLIQTKRSTVKAQRAEEERSLHPLLKLRTDLDRITPKIEKVLTKLPFWKPSWFSVHQFASLDGFYMQSIVHLKIPISCKKPCQGGCCKQAAVWRNHGHEKPSLNFLGDVKLQTLRTFPSQPQAMRAQVNNKQEATLVKGIGEIQGM
ncbi:hypothetical protein SAY87_007849 [Trapa incisa]|uniref:Vacuolar membrane protease n=1 Tax=Trapa incisa TaxID=236973 RepID=A0AAN7KNS7_9MYRT|nr:hypothetical protein SAY87_007849 [Trapa incisa]